MSIAEWQSRLQQRIESVPNRIESARRIYAEIGPWLRHYHGGMPVGFLAAITQWESGGKMSSTGDPSLGEVGFFQITSSFPPKVGIPAERRYEPEVNIFLGCLEYQMRAVELRLKFPFISLGGSDSWKLARLAFAIGLGGTSTLIENATRGRPILDVYPLIKNYVNATGGIPLGSQEAGKIWYRVHSVELQWQIGQSVFPYFDIGAPVRIPAPPNTQYSLPLEIAPFMPSPFRGPLLAAGLGILSFLA